MLYYSDVAQGETFATTPSFACSDLQIRTSLTAMHMIEAFESSQPHTSSIQQHKQDEIHVIAQTSESGIRCMYNGGGNGQSNATRNDGKWC